MAAGGDDVLSVGCLGVRVAVEAGEESTLGGGVRRTGGRPELFAQAGVGIGGGAGDGGEGRGTAERRGQVERLAAELVAEVAPLRGDEGLLRRGFPDGRLSAQLPGLMKLVARPLPKLSRGQAADVVAAALLRGVGAQRGGSRR